MRCDGMAWPGRDRHHWGKADGLQRICAAVTVFCRSIAMVIGPTPPGTGVSAPATSRTALSTSPHSPLLVRWIPTSTTVAPGFTPSAPMSLGIPAATTSTSAWRHTAATSLLREWHTVTVAWRCNSN